MTATAVVATAGHVDHGKSTLVRALTGTDPDRWAEEQRRGLTLDLGYATCALPSGRQLSLVDVPGHERYVGNALCGLAPVRVVLLVVAADQGWQRQSGEHLDAVQALGIEHVVLAVTRSDLADPGPALTDARARLSAVPHVETVTTPGAAGLAGSVGAAALVGVTGLVGLVGAAALVGVTGLAAALDRCLDRVAVPDSTAPVRLWLDRSFDVRGRGRVVTGTLEAGTLRVGDRLVTAAGDEVRVRGLQVHGGDADEVVGSARVAVAVRTGTDLTRGSVLLVPGAHHLTDVVDVSLTAPLPSRPGQLVLHLGTVALPVRVRPLGRYHVRLVLPERVPLRVGDRAVLRDPGAHRVLSGAVAVDVAPLPLTRRGAAAARSRELADADPLALALARGPQRLRDLSAQGLDLTARLGSGSAPERGRSTETSTDSVRIGDWVSTDRQLHALGVQLAQALADLPPTAPGLAVTALAERLGIAPALVGTVADSAGATVRAGTVVNPRHSLGPADAAVRALEAHLRSHPLAAPDRGQLRERGLDAKALATAHAHGLLLRLAPDVVVHPTAPERAERVLAGVPQPFTPGEAARALGASRRVVVPLLEHLDATGRTTRDGSLRQLGSSAGGSRTTVSRRAR